MLYEEKREKVGLAVRDVGKMTSKNNEVVLDSRNPELKGILVREIEAILYKFDEEKKIKFIERKSNEPFELAFEQEPKTGMSFRIKVLDLEYFDQFLPKKPYKNPIIEIQDEITGLTAKERAEIQALKEAKTQAISKTISSENYFFIDYKSDRNIRLNGKILMCKPQLRENEVLFKYLYDNPDKEFTKQELSTILGISISDTFQKLTDRWGFRAGFRDTFFDVHDNTINPEKSTIKFKNHIRL